MQMTKERFEHELVKLKTMVGPEFVGCAYDFSNGRGGHCIMGQIMLNCGVPESQLVTPAEINDNGVREQFYGYSDLDVYRMVLKAVMMNNDGVPWHRIVDALVPQSPEPQIEPLSVEEPELVAV